MSQVVEQIHELFEAACKELFEGMNCQVSRVDAPYDEYELEDAPAAFIDAGSDDLELNIGILMPLSLLAMTYPVQDNITQVDDATLEDWISELANRLIGLIKAHLLHRECRVMIGLPNFFHGADVDYASLGNGEFYSLYFDVDNIVCECSISVEIFNDQMLLAEPQATESASDEDDGIEFF
ncbi:MAG: hypothetical protein H6999_05975 [Hahellaceae bacterium]|nr:hypothetical protein [Hahellaceae bacterium]MCP5169288.1 hypothetical protein [Hahellaceae bacterium]